MFIELNMMITFFIFRRPIIIGWGRDMGMIFWPIRNSIRICGWRLDRQVDPIKIRFTGSPTLWLTTCGRLVVFQPLGAPNQYQAPNLRSSWPCSGSAHRKIRPPISGVRTTQSVSCRTKSGICTTKNNLWTASRNGHEHGNTEWNMCA